MLCARLVYKGLDWRKESLRRYIAQIILHFTSNWQQLQTEFIASNSVEGVLTKLVL